MNLPRLLLTGLGLGRFPIGPGTIGSLAPVVVVLVLAHAGAAGWLIHGALVMIAVMFAIICLTFGGAEERRLGAADPSHIVADEIAGQSLALLFLPWHQPASAGVTMTDLTIAGVGFVTFRVLDIVKPYPIGRLQRLPGGVGILADDLLAGLEALAITQLIARTLLA